MTPTRRAALGALALAGAAPVLVRPAAAQDAAEYVATMLRDGDKLRRMSELARERAGDQAVATFAQLEVAEQEAVAAVLTATGAGMPEMEVETAALLEEMAAQQAGGFTTIYLQEMRKGHLAALELQMRMAAMQEMTVPVVTATLQKPAVESHLAMLDMIERVT